ncbi:MAG: hypothetical protein ACFFB2_03665 [Promethearchaeota archaeon]
MSTPDSQNLEVLYRRWIILIPILMIIVGSAIMAVVGPYNKSVALIGGIIVFIGILIFGTLISIIIGIEFGVRTLAKKVQAPLSFREQIEANESFNKENQHD